VFNISIEGKNYIYIDTCSKFKIHMFLAHILKNISIFKCKYTHVLHIFSSKFMWYKIKTKKTLILHLNKIYNCILRTSNSFSKLKNNFVKESYLQD
jgi:hypothetical protein